VFGLGNLLEESALEYYSSITWFVILNWESNMYCIFLEIERTINLNFDMTT